MGFTIPTVPTRYVSPQCGRACHLHIQGSLSGHLSRHVCKTPLIFVGSHFGTGSYHSQYHVPSHGWSQKISMGILALQIFQLWCHTTRPPWNPCHYSQQSNPTQIMVLQMTVWFQRRCCAQPLLLSASYWCRCESGFHHKHARVSSPVPHSSRSPANWSPHSCAPHAYIWSAPRSSSQYWTVAPSDLPNVSPIPYPERYQDHNFSWI